MLLHLLNLLARTVVDFPTVISGNWLSILLPVALYLVKDGKSLYSKYKSGSLMTAQVKRDTWLLGWIYVGLFCIALTRTVYRDHEYFVAKALEFRRTIRGDGETLGQVKHQDEVAYSQLQSGCSKKDGIVETLQNQNRDQQGTINNCQTQAMKLLTPEGEKLTVLTWDDKPIIEGGVDREADYLLITNKVVTPVRITGSYDVFLKTMTADPVGIGAYSGGANITKTNQLRSFSQPLSSQFNIAFGTPAWAPTTPIRVKISYTSARTAVCTFSVR